MDLYCLRCGEPWDNDTFHDAAEEQDLSYDEVAARFRQKGCVAITEVECKRRTSKRTLLASAMYDMMGDDMDGSAAMFEDAEYLGEI